MGSRWNERPALPLLLLVRERLADDRSLPRVAYNTHAQTMDGPTKSQRHICRIELHCLQKALWLPVGFAREFFVTESQEITPGHPTAHAFRAICQQSIALRIRLCHCSYRRIQA